MAPIRGSTLSHGAISSRSIEPRSHASLRSRCRGSPFPARTIRDPLKARLGYAMFCHVEHHLFPAVPTCHLPALAARLDPTAPDLAAHHVF